MLNQPAVIEGLIVGFCGLPNRRRGREHLAWPESDMAETSWDTGIHAYYGTKPCSESLRIVSCRRRLNTFPAGRFISGRSTVICSPH